MGDEKIKNQDVGPDQNPVPSPEAEEALIAEVDAFLAGEDPQFLADIEKISVSSSELDVDIMGEALGLTRPDRWGFIRDLGRPFHFRTNTKPVIFFWAIVLLCGVIGYFTWSFKDSLLTSKLFLTSFAEIGTDISDYDHVTETELFYDNARFAKNLVTISSMYVNLRPSESSGENPMLALEVTIEGLSSDAIVEIKDREAEFKDKLLQITAEKTYDELIVAEGKVLLCEQYRDALNTLLTRGQVRKVLLKAFVIKP